MFENLTFLSVYLTFKIDSFTMNIPASFIPDTTDQFNKISTSQHAGAFMQHIHLTAI